MANRIDETGDARIAGDPADTPSHRRLRGTLGVWGIVFVVVAAASPLGVIGGPVPLGIASGNGVGFPAIFIISTVIVLLFAVGFTALTPHVPNAGAFYSYIGKGLGRVTGFGFAFVALISYLALEIGVYGLIGQGAQALFSSYGAPNIHWGVWALITLLIVAVLGHRNIDLSRNVLGVLLIAEVAIVLVLDAVVAVTGGHEGLSTGFLSPSEIVSGAPGIALLFAFLSFIGFEATAVFRDEARDPVRTIPRATFLALLLIGVFYRLDMGADHGVGRQPRRRAGRRGSVGAAPGSDRAVSRLGRSAHRAGAVRHQLVRVHPVVPQRRCALCVHAVEPQRVPRVAG